MLEKPELTYWANRIGVAEPQVSRELRGADEVGFRGHEAGGVGGSP